MKIESANSRILNQYPSSEGAPKSEIKGNVSSANPSPSEDIVTLSTDVSRTTEEHSVEQIEKVKAEKEVEKKDKKEEQKRELENNKVTPKILLRSADRLYDYYINKNENLAIKVIDKSSKEPIKEIPPESQQDLTAAIKKVVSDLSD